MSRRLAFVTEFCPPYRTGFYETVADRFDETILFCDTRDSWRAFGEFDYRELRGVQLRGRYSVTPSVFGHLRSIQPDVIVGSPIEGFGGQSAYLYAQATGTPFVLWTGEWHVPLTTLRTLTFPLIRQIYRGADAIAVYGPHVKRYLIDLGVNTDKISIAWNTVDVSKFETTPEGTEMSLREEHEIPPDAPVALYVGRLVEEKGVEYLLKAFESISEEVDPTPHLLIVGDGDRRKQLEAMAADVPTVSFPGYVNNDDLPRYYALADAFVLPSVHTTEFREAWGLVVNEAMATGTPVVATGQVGAAAGGLVSHGESGYVVPERNAPALADKLGQLLEDTDHAEQLGEHARTAVGEFHYERMVDGVEQAIERAVRAT